MFKKLLPYGLFALVTCMASPSVLAASSSILAPKQWVMDQLVVSNASDFATSNPNSIAYKAAHGGGGGGGSGITTNDVRNIVTNMIPTYKIFSGASEVHADGSVYRPTNQTWTLTFTHGLTFSRSGEPVTPVPYFDYIENRWHLGESGSAEVATSDVPGLTGDVSKFEADGGIDATTLIFTIPKLGTEVFATGIVATAATPVRVGTAAILPHGDGMRIEVGTMVKMGTNGVLAAAQQSDYVNPSQIADMQLKSLIVASNQEETVDDEHYPSTGKMEERIASAISHTDLRFSNEVLQVATGISTNDFAAIRAIASDVADLPIGTTTTTIGGILLALSAAALALKRKKLDTSAVGSEWSESTTYAKGDNVVYEGKFYVSKAASNKGHKPTDTTWWDVSTLFTSDNTSLNAAIDAEIAARCASLNPDTSSIADIIKTLKGTN